MLSPVAIDKTGDSTREEKWTEADRLIALGVPVARAMKQVGMHRTAYYKREESRRHAEAQKGQEGAA